MRRAGSKQSPSRLERGIVGYTGEISLGQLSSCRIHTIPFLVGFRFEVFCPAMTRSYMIFLAIFHAEALIPHDLFSTKGAMPVFACHKIPRRVAQIMRFTAIAEPPNLISK
jgi:hypothetical protein